MKSRQKRTIVGTLLIVGAFVSLVVTSMRSNLRSVPVSQLRAADSTPDSFLNQHLRIVGFVSHDQIRKTPLQTPNGLVQVNSFTVVDKGCKLSVEYKDALPDTFKAGSPVQVDGLYSATGMMRADHVYTKCPSKYEATQDAKHEAALAKSGVKS